MRSYARAVLFVLMVILPGVADAEGLPEPQGDVILTVTGKTKATAPGGEVRFDMALLEQLPHHVVRTANPWQDWLTAYEGVLLRDLLAAVGADGSVMTIYALDNYHEHIDVADAQSIDVILAYKRDGQYMPVRKMGPLFVVFPFSDDPSLLTDKRRDQSVWQVNRIDIK